MQTDAISRSAVLPALVNHNEGYLMYCDWHDCKAECEAAINSIPALDAVPVVHARWIYSGEMDEDGNCEANCSHCGAGDKHRADLKDAVPYCWKCGARMDGEADG